MIDKLYDSTRIYNSSLRWGDWDRAAEYLPQACTDAFLDTHMAVDEKVVVLDYEMTRMEIDKANGVAVSQVQIQWHTDRNLVVRSTTVDHVWQWYEGRWILVDERRSGGRPLAIFAEMEEGAQHPYLPGLAAFRDEFAIGLDPSEKRAREKEQRAAEKARAEQGPTIEDLDSLPTRQKPASFN